MTGLYFFADKSTVQKVQYREFRKEKMKRHLLRPFLMGIAIIALLIVLVLSHNSAIWAGDYTVGEFDFPDEACETAFRNAVNTAFGSRGFSFSKEVPAFLKGTVCILRTDQSESFWLFNEKQKYAVFFMDIGSHNLYVNTHYLVTMSSLTQKYRISRAERDQQEIARELRQIDESLRNPGKTADILRGE